MAKNKVPQKDFVKNFSAAQEQLLKHFDCDEDFFLKPLPASRWSIKNEGEFYFLYYWLDDEKRMDAVVVKKNGQPMLFKTEKYTMVIGIDCVKIGFIFHNGNKRSSI